MDVNREFVSQYTLNNWARLNKTQKDGESFARRANKKLSAKRIIPLEYISNPKNMPALEALADLVVASENTANAMYSLCLKLLEAHGLVEARGGTLVPLDGKAAWFEEFHSHSFDSSFCKCEVPVDEFDPVGMVYQIAKTEGEKNISGSYFTPLGAVKLLAGQILAGENFLDPCCGTGGILLNVEGCSDPALLYGCDIDATAAMIARCNLIVKYKSHSFCPNIVNCDFLAEKPFEGVLFDTIGTNPPWGALSRGESLGKKEDSFAHVVYKSLETLAEGAVASFLLPEAFLNVARHSRLREILSQNVSIISVALIGKIFSGVYTGVVAIKIKNVSPSGLWQVEVAKDGAAHTISQKDIADKPTFAYYTCEPAFLEIMDGIYKVRHRNLDATSVWGMGIVTGDNKKTLSAEMLEGYEPIYKGKDIRPYMLAAPSSYVDYHNTVFQQKAPDSLYRAKPKLAYKFISGKLVFAIDEAGSLFLNSANLLVPQLGDMHINVALAFLNSDVFNFINKVRFRQVKVLKSNLMRLPFPYIGEQEELMLNSLAEKAISGDESAHNDIQGLVYEIFQVKRSYISHIRNALK
ncbi:MAG: N-6 DNA methylase [Eubacteriaceae bacterium]|nr:N-6 DNA methylase [Eubacteriaceae bacterium]